MSYVVLYKILSITKFKAKVAVKIKQFGALKTYRIVLFGVIPSPESSLGSKKFEIFKF